MQGYRKWQLDILFSVIQSMYDYVAMHKEIEILKNEKLKLGQESDKLKAVVDNQFSLSMKISSTLSTFFLNSCIVPCYIAGTWNNIW